MTHCLFSQDSAVVHISDKALKQSVYLATMLRDTASGGSVPFPLKIPGHTLKKVVEWCEHHREDPPPEPKKEEAVGPRPPPPIFEIPEWDDAFLTVGEAEMYHLITAANFLDIPWLYRFLCKKLYLLFIKDQPPAELKKRFEPPN
uniref:Skp1-related protein n=1 Tax=Steinernema glaseri TaxID=37863 RepID=A0A1I8ASU2_9BILA